MEPPTGAPRHGWAVGGQRARSQPGRVAFEVTEAVATQEPGSVRAAAARAGRNDRA
jgi:hypothetical protein